MAATVVDAHCCRDAPAMEDSGRSSEGCLGVDVDKRVRELPETILETASDVLPQGLEGGEDATVLNNVHAHDAVRSDVLLSSSSQQNTERKKNEAVSLASDVEAISVPVIDKTKSYKWRIKHDNQPEGAYVNSTSVANVDKSTNQSNMSQVGEEVHTRKEGALHSDDHDVGVVPGNKQVGIKEGMLEEIHALDDLSQEKERKTARKTGSFDRSAAGPIRETNESGTRDVTKSDRVPLEANINSCGELSNSSFQQEVHENVQEDSIHLENPSIAGKNRKRKRRQSVASKEVVSAQEMTKPSTGAVEVPKAIGEVLLHRDNKGLQGDGAYNVELTSRDKTMSRPSDTLLSSSQLNNGNQGTKDVQLVSDAQETTDLVADQGNIGLVHKGSRNPTINSTSEVVAGEEKSTKGGNAPWDGGKKHARKKQPTDDDGGHDEVIVETSNMEKAGKSKNILEKIHTAGNTSQEKKRKKEKKVSSVDITSMDTAGEKDLCGYGENAIKLDMVSTQGGNGLSKQQISSNVLQGDSNVMKNLSGGGKRKKRGHCSESSKGSDSTQDVTKSSGLITNESSIQNTNAAPLDAKQTTPGTIGEATVGDHKKLDESLDKATANVIDEVLADLRSTDSLSKDLDGDLLTEQTHLGSNQNVLGLLGNIGDKGGVSAALPPKYPSAVHSDAPISSPSHKKSKGKQLKVLSTVLGSSRSSGGVPEENANTEIRESEKNSDLEDIVTENIVSQADDKTKATKRQRKKISLHHVPTDNGKASQSSGEQINHDATEDLKGANTTKADLVQGGSIIDTRVGTDS